MTLERTTVHVADDTGRIAMLEVRTVGTDPAPAELVRYIYSNHLGTASLELDENADIISYEEYHPYGTTSYQAMNSSIAAVAKRYRYTGKERDEETGLYYHGARYYIPWLTRWMACDPINNEWYNVSHGTPTRNLEKGFDELTGSSYEYCYNNPVRFIDPTGERGVPAPVMRPMPPPVRPAVAPKGGAKYAPGTTPKMDNTRNSGDRIVIPGKGVFVPDYTKYGAGGWTRAPNTHPGLTFPGEKGYPVQKPAVMTPQQLAAFLQKHKPQAVANTQTPPLFGNTLDQQLLKAPNRQLKPNSFHIPLQKELNGNTPIYRSMNQENGNWIPSPLTGAPNSSQMGARTPESIKPGTKSKADVHPINGWVGPLFTGLEGLSANVNMPDDARPTGKIEANKLPVGLRAVQDKLDGHVSIMPAGNMDFKSYQKLLNSINWQRIK